jgi:hypothetical protein
MEKKNYASLLKDEYIMLQNFYEDIDAKGLNIKNWSITVALAAIGTGLVYESNILLVACATALMFWILEAYWRGLSYFFVVRIKNIEKAFANSTEDKEIPLQVYSTWDKAYKKDGGKTIEYMFKFSSLLPHVAIIAISLILYFTGISFAP